jgi:hypothetical protein
VYSSRQARIQSGVNGGRFASYGDPHTSKASTKPSRSGKAKATKKARSGKQTKRRQRSAKQLTVSQKARVMSRHTRAASRGKGRLRGRHR